MPPLGRAVATFAPCEDFLHWFQRGFAVAGAFGPGRAGHAAWRPFRARPGPLATGTEECPGTSPRHSRHRAAARLRSIRPPSRAGQGRSSQLGHGAHSVYRRVMTAIKAALTASTDVLHCSAIGSAPLYGPRRGHVPPACPHVSAGPLKPPSTVSAGARVRLSCDRMRHSQ